VDSNLLGLGAATAFLGVLFGAFGTHGLRDRVDASMLATWNTGVHYHLLHALALLAVALAAERIPGLRLVGWMFLGGVVLFSGTLYLYVITQNRSFAMVTPAGGLLFLAGWALFAFRAWRA
jgi:uncharacterized membrane protein YgdD (TMEM256/DUF423 family)